MSLARPRIKQASANAGDGSGGQPRRNCYARGFAAWSRAVRFAPLLLLLALHFPAAAQVAIEIDLTAQKAFVLQDGHVVYETPISSGRRSHPTPTGNFAVSEKDSNHLSSLYGRVVDGSGRVVVRDACSDTPVPAGGKFVRAPMKHFLRFDGATGMHGGRLPGYPASHGCVRLPSLKAELFYDIAEVGTPVRVFGQAPAGGRSSSSKPRVTPTPPPTPPPRQWRQILRRDRPPLKPFAKP